MENPDHLDAVIARTVKNQVISVTIHREASQSDCKFVTPLTGTRMLRQKSDRIVDRLVDEPGRPSIPSTEVKKNLNDIQPTDGRADDASHQPARFSCC